MQRKYSSTRSNAARKIAASMLPATCICGHIVTADMQWQADHITPRAVAEQQGWASTEIDSPTNLRPLHKSCNESSGAKLGNELRAKAKAQPRKITPIKRPQLEFFDGALPSPGGALHVFSPIAGETSQEATGAP